LNSRIAAANRQVEAATAAVKAVAKERETCAKQPLPFDAAYAVAEGKTAGKKKVGNACVQIKGDRFRARARVAEGEERERLWELMNEVWPYYDEYATRTEREIPVVVLERE